MFGRYMLAAGSTLLSVALAQGFCTSTGTGFADIPGFVEPHSCVPVGYFQAQDLGQISQAQLTTVCQNQCNTYGPQCAGFVGQVWFAADSPLSTGQCFYYNTAPAGPRFCADSPGGIVGQAKGSGSALNPVVSCLSASPAAASPFCSAFVTANPAGSGPTLTITSTPIVTVTSATVTASDSTTFVASAFTTTTETVTLTTTIFSATTDTTTTSTSSSTTTVETDFPSLTSPTPSTTFTITVSDATTTTTETIIQKRDVTATRWAPAMRFAATKLRRNLKPRQTVAIPPPACFPGGSSDSDVSAACSCIGVTSASGGVSVTATTVITAPTSTFTIMTATSIIGSTTSTTSGTLTSLSSTTVFTTGTLTITTTTTTTVTASATATHSCADCNECVDSTECRGGFECAAYVGFPFGDVNLCSNEDPAGVDYVCPSICTDTLTASATTTSSTSTSTTDTITTTTTSSTSTTSTSTTSTSTTTV